MIFSFLFGNLLGENSHQSYSCQPLRSAAAARCFHTGLITQAIVCSLSFTLAMDCLKAIWNKLESLSCCRDTIEDDPEFAVMALMSVYSQCIHYLHCRITFLTHSRYIHKCQGCTVSCQAASNNYLRCCRCFYELRGKCQVCKIVSQKKVQVNSSFFFTSCEIYIKKHYNYIQLRKPLTFEYLTYCFDKQLING